MVTVNKKINIAFGQLIGETLWKYLFKLYGAKHIIEYIEEDIWKIMDTNEYNVLNNNDLSQQNYSSDFFIYNVFIIRINNYRILLKLL